MLEKAYNVYILRRCQLHARDGNYSVFACRFEKGRAVFCAVMIGQGNYIKLGELCHTENVVRSIVIIRAR